MTERASLIMYAVAALSGIAGGAVLYGRPADEAARYRKRIAGTMLIALAFILASFATAARTAI